MDTDAVFTPAPWDSGRTKSNRCQFTSGFKAKPSLLASYLSLGAMALAGAVLLMAGHIQAQNLFVSSYQQGQVIVFQPSGVESLFTSGLDGPDGLAFNRSGNLFEGDSVSGNIYEFTPKGVRSTFASGLYYSNIGLAFNAAGDLFVSVPSSNSIYELTPDGVKTTFASGLNAPVGLAFDNAGNLFVAESGSGNIYKFTPGGMKTAFASLTAYEPTGLAFDSTGNLFVSMYQANTIIKITPSGAKSIFASGLDEPGAMAVNSAGDLFVVDGVSGNIYKFTPTGVKSTFASGLYGLTGIAFQVPAPPHPVLGIRQSFNAVYLSASDLVAGCRYQWSASSDLSNWTNWGSAFVATNTVWTSTNNWNIGATNNTLFRLQTPQ